MHLQPIHTIIPCKCAGFGIWVLQTGLTGAEQNDAPDPAACSQELLKPWRIELRLRQGDAVFIENQVQCTGSMRLKIRFRHKKKLRGDFIKHVTCRDDDIMETDGWTMCTRRASPDWIRVLLDLASSPCYQPQLHLTTSPNSCSWAATPRPAQDDEKRAAVSGVGGKVFIIRN
jgi:hypothetical protein